jgi:hypothetical protein
MVCGCSYKSLSFIFLFFRHTHFIFDLNTHLPRLSEYVYLFHSTRYQLNTVSTKVFCARSHPSKNEESLLFILLTLNPYGSITPASFDGLVNLLNQKVSHTPPRTHNRHPRPHRLHLQRIQIGTRDGNAASVILISKTLPVTLDVGHGTVTIA